jgi:hypothetical protein
VAFEVGLKGVWPGCSGQGVSLRWHAIGTSIFTTLWEDRAAMHHENLAEAVNRSIDQQT